MVLVHFKVEFCPLTNPSEICEHLFPERGLCVLHKGKGNNPHWHFQGEWDRKFEILDRFLDDIRSSHSKRITQPSCRPVKRTKKDITEVGYQYMLKESKDSNDANIIWKKGITNEEIEDWIILSKSHVADLKNQLPDYLKKNFGVFQTNAAWILPSFSDGQWAKRVHEHMQELALDYYQSEGKMFPPGLRKLIIYHGLNILREWNEEQYQKFKSYATTIVC